MGKISKRLNRLGKKQLLLRQGAEDRKWRRNPFISYVKKKESEGLYIFLGRTEKVLALIFPDGSIGGAKPSLFSEVQSQYWKTFSRSSAVSPAQLNRFLGLHPHLELDRNISLNSPSEPVAPCPPKKGNRKKKRRSAYMYAGKTGTFVIGQPPHKKGR